MPFNRRKIKKKRNPTVWFNDIETFLVSFVNIISMDVCFTEDLPKEKQARFFDKKVYIECIWHRSY